ncbi:MAG TPA: hypothetical protein VG895_04575 [Patescibacteria group bacterium]|nr:hypothetical protein [Patescibacteria group bacterium]
MTKLISKFLISIITSLVLVFSIVPAAMAQTPNPAQVGTQGVGQALQGAAPESSTNTTSATPGPWYNQNFGQWSAKVFDSSNPNEIFGERYTYAQVNWIINSLIAVIIGSDISSCISSGSNGNVSSIGTCAAKLLPSNQTSNNTGMKGGTFTALSYLGGTLMNFKPASGVNYTKQIASNLHVISPAYAQSTSAGFATLSPVQSLWQVVRDISYSLMVVIIIIAAFAIMFRLKLSPQLTASIQSILPRIAVALILITFSYAIAGFLIDLMYVVIGAFAVMVKIGGSTLSTGSVLYLFGQLNSINGLTSLFIGMLIFIVLLVGGGALLTLGAISAGVISGGISVLGIPVGIIIVLVGVIFVGWIILRLIWLLVKTSVITVLLIIASPFMILGDTLDIGGGFISWFRTLAANLAVYPTVTIMIFLAHYFFWGWAAGALTQIFPTNNPFNTYAISALNINGTSGVINLPGMPIGTSIIGFFAAFIIVFLIPKAADVVEGIIKGKGVDVGGAVKESHGPVRALLASRAASYETYKRSLPGGDPKYVDPVAQFLRSTGIM